MMHQQDTRQKNRALMAGTLSVFATIAVAAVLLSDMLPSPFGGYADQRFLLVLLLGLLIIGFLGYSLKEAQLVSTGVALSLIPCLVLSSSFLLLALPFWGQAYLWVEPVMYAFFFLAICLGGCALSINRSVEQYVRLLIVIIAGGCMAYGAMSVNVYLFTLNDGVSRLSDFIPWGFVNIRYWSHIATWCLPLLPLAVLVGAMKQHRLWRAAVATAAGIWWWIILLSSARGSVLGIVIGSLLAVVMIGRPAIPWLKISLRYLLIGVGLWLVFSVLIPSFIFDEVRVRAVTSDSAGRMPLFAEAWAMSFQNFPFGMGPQSWLTHEVITESYSQSRKFGHPHNMYLMWAAEYGWVLVVVMAGLVIQAVRNFWIQKRPAQSLKGSDLPLFLAGFGASVAAAMVHSAASAVFLAPGSMLIGLFVLIGFWGLVTPNGSSNVLGRVSQHRKRTRAGLFFGIFIVTLIWAGWVHEVWRYHGDMVSDLNENASGRMLPRFWFHGAYPRELPGS